MSAKLRWEQCCTGTVEHKPCTRPARELGGFCTRCYLALSPAARGSLAESARWEAASWREAPSEPRYLTTPQVGAIALLSYDPVAGAEAILRTS